MTLIFLHIPKTAGISLRQVLHRNISGPTFRIIHPIDDAARLAALPAADRASLDLVEGHLYHGVHEHIPRPCRYLTMLRDPVERTLSYYSFVREYKDHHLYQTIHSKRLSLSDCFRAGLTVELDNFMVRCLTSLRNIHVPFGGVTRSMFDEAVANLAAIDLVGLTEEYDRSVAFFCDALGWPRAVGARQNATNDRLRRADMSDSDLDLIREHNRLDLELYAHIAPGVHARLGAVTAA